MKETVKEMLDHQSQIRNKLMGWVKEYVEEAVIGNCGGL